MIEVTKISSKGQVTIPVEIRKALKITEGSKVAFVSDENGRWYIANASLIALKDVEKAFEGVSDSLGIDSEDEVDAFLKKDRASRG